MDIPAQTFQSGDEIDGFTVRNVTALNNLRCNAYQFEHLGSGANLIHLHGSDPENLFAIGFPTPPPDDTGFATHT